MAIIAALEDKIPAIHQSVFVAENATIVGSVSIDAESSIWYNAVLRGDVAPIFIGKQSNIQDGAVLHGSLHRSETRIGDNVTIGHKAIIHGAKIEDNVLIGMGAIVLDNAVVPSWTMVAAASVVLENSILESGYLYAGIPAKKIKLLTEENLKSIRNTASHYPLSAKWNKEKTDLTQHEQK